jgi:hypothetical protein
MKYLLYSTLLFALVARADDLLPEGTQVEAAPQVESAEEAKLSEPVAPSLALPVESPAIATATAVSVSTSTDIAAPTLAEKPAQEPIDPAPVETTAEQAAPPPVAAPQISYGPSAEEGYGSVGLKNEGQFMEVGGDKKTEEKPEDGDRKTSSLPEETVDSQ